MLDQILAMLRNAIDAASLWFLQIIDSLDGNWYGFIITMITIFLFSRFILKPLFGQTWGSDAVKPEPETRRIGFTGGDRKSGRYN